MKITILPKELGEEDEIIIKCDNLDSNLLKLVNSIKNGNTRRSFYKDSQICLVEEKDILYFESVDDIVFAYTENEVFQTKSKLYQLEDELCKQSFFRANKAVIVNIDKIKNISPAFNGRFEALLKNGYKVIISRNYVSKLKELLDIN